MPHLRNLKEAAKSKPPVVRVGRETKGRRGKGVTTVSDVPLDDAGLLELAAKLKQRCGTGGTVKDGRIEIQGDQRSRLTGELEGWVPGRTGWRLTLTKRPSKTPQAASIAQSLVPKLRLGTHVAKLRFASLPARKIDAQAQGAKRSFEDWRSQTEFGSQEQLPACCSVKPLRPDPYVAHFCIFAAIGLIRFCDPILLNPVMPAGSRRDCLIQVCRQER